MSTLPNITTTQISGLNPNPSPALTDKIAIDNASAVTYYETLSQLNTLFGANITIAESQVTNLTTDLASKLNLTGGTLTGNLTLSGAATLTLANPLTKGNGGTGYTDYTDGQLLIGNSSGNTLTKSTLTAGIGTSITNGNGSITISSAGISHNVTLVDFSMTPYTVLSTDTYLSLDVTNGPITILLPNSRTDDASLTIKCSVGNVAANNVTVTTVGGSVIIDDATTYIMNISQASITVTYVSGRTKYEVN